jgi:NhaC family Na+:H+ antiporter
MWRRLIKARPNPPQELTYGEALIPVGALIVLVGLAFYLFRGDAASGPNQIALVFCAIIAVWVAWRRGHTIESQRDAAVASVASAIPAIFILLAVGALIGTWAMSGTLLGMVYFGLKLLNPDYFYLTTCAICAVVALSIGSSWTVAGTIGIGLMGVAEKMGLDPAITAGAVISGAYFGDKASPLSDTANLACAAAGANLYDHIRESLYTSVPALIAALAIFGTLGNPIVFDEAGALAEIQAVYQPTFVVFLPLVIVIALALGRCPPFIAIFVGALAGGVVALVINQDAVLAFADAAQLTPDLALLKGMWGALATGYVSETGVTTVDALLTRGGMASMMTTVWLILAALAFGGIVEKAGIFEKLLGPVIRAAHRTWALVTTLVGAAIATNVLAADQYMAVVLPGRMLRKAFEQRGLAPVVLSRSLGDSATVTSPLIPWNSCGAYMAATLGVSATAFAPYCFFNLLNPLITIVFAALGLRVLTAPSVARDEVPTQPPAAS